MNEVQAAAVAQIIEANSGGRENPLSLIERVEVLEGQMAMAVESLTLMTRQNERLTQRVEWLEARAQDKGW